MNRTSTAHRFRFRMFVVLIAGTLTLSGCQGDPDEARTGSPSSSPPTSTAVSAPPTASPDPSGGASTAAPEPSPASSIGPAANIPVPTKPALADENSKEGLEAFTRYWFELLNYAYETNDWAPFDAETDPGCRTCASIKGNVSALYDQGRWVQGANISVVSFSTEFEESVTGSISSFVENQQGQIVYFNADGTELKVTPMQPEPAIDVVIAIWDKGSWLMLDYGTPEGT